MKKTIKIKEPTEEINPIYLSNELFLDLFLDWANANPELFDNKYSELSNGLTASINSQPEIIAALIEKLPNLFPIWLTKSDELIGTAKIDELKRIASILEKTITKEYDDEIIEHSRKKMINTAKEYLDIINSLLDPPQQTRNRIGFRRKDEQE